MHCSTGTRRAAADRPMPETENYREKRGLCRIAILVAVAFPAVATADVADDARTCAGVENADARLACYDALFRPDQEEPAAVPASPAAEPVRTTAESAPAKEIAAAPAAAELGADDLRRTQPPERPTETTAVIVSIDELRSGARLFELDNGQVWREKRNKPGLRLSAGDEVRIKAGSLGSYKLFGGGKTSTSVERIR